MVKASELHVCRFYEGKWTLKVAKQNAVNLRDIAAFKGTAVVSPLHGGCSHLFTKWRSPGAFGLLVAFGQRSVTGAEPFARSVVNLHGDALGGPLLGVRLHVEHFPVPQEVFEPGEELREFPGVTGGMGG